MMDFTGKVALVTGGARGIGAATVMAIVAAGGQVVIHYGTREDAAETLARDVGRSHCHLVRADLADPAAAASLWKAALAWQGKIDILINNAGVFLAEDRGGPDEAWQAVWARTLQINLVAPADLCRAAISHWLDSGTGGAIVNVASRAAFRGDDQDHWSYAASKGALVSLTKTLARAYSRNGIYSYGIAPGFVLTDMAMAEFERAEGSAERLLKEVPYGAFAPAHEIASAICFFAAGLATHATGQTLDINGASYVR